MHSSINETFSTDDYTSLHVNDRHTIIFSCNYVHKLMFCLMFWYISQSNSSNLSILINFSVYHQTYPSHFSLYMFKQWIMDTHKLTLKFRFDVSAMMCLTAIFCIRLIKFSITIFHLLIHESPTCFTKVNKKECLCVSTVRWPARMGVFTLEKIRQNNSFQ